MHLLEWLALHMPAWYLNIIDFCILLCCRLRWDLASQCVNGGHEMKFLIDLHEIVKWWNCPRFMLIFVQQLRSKFICTFTKKKNYHEHSENAFKNVELEANQSTHHCTCALTINNSSWNSHRMLFLQRFIRLLFHYAADCSISCNLKNTIKTRHCNHLTRIVISREQDEYRIAPPVHDYSTDGW